MDKLKEKKAGQEISANQVGSKEQKSTTTQEKAKEKENTITQEKAKEKENTTTQEKAKEKENTAAQEKTKEKENTTAQKKSKEKESTEEQKKTGKVAKKAASFVLAVVLLLGLGAYGGVSVYYRTHFFPNTSVNQVDCSNLDASQVSAILEQQLQTYVLKVTGRDYKTGESGAELGTITAADVELSYVDNSQVAAEMLLQQQNPFTWPVRVLKKVSQGNTMVEGVTFNQEKLAELVSSWQACQKGNMQEPEDAYISEYMSSKKAYEIIPETEGTFLNIDQLQEQIAAAIEKHEEHIDAEECGCYKAAKVISTDENLVKTVEKANKMLGTKITYDWNGTEVILDGDQIKNWVEISGNTVTLDEEAVAEFVKAQAKEYDTYGKNRKFTTTLGVELTLPSGHYGWQTDKNAETEELIQLISKGSVENREPIYSSTARKKGMSDIGSSYVEADLTNQHLYLYKDGKIVLETDFVSGNMSSTPDCVTPQGVFGLSYKTTNAVLRGATYQTPVNYWMPFYGNYGMHDATWRSTFGGEIYIMSGSHGCINLPLDAAASIYEYVSTGFPVICYYYPGAVAQTVAQPGTTAPPDETTPEEPPASESDDDSEDEE